VIYDTGSDWLAVDTTVFNSADSTSFINLYRAEKLLYGSAELDGNLATDHVYLNHPNFGVDDFPFIAI
jgi:hypothetical protein